MANSPPHSIKLESRELASKSCRPQELDTSWSLREACAVFLTSGTRAHICSSCIRRDQDHECIKCCRDAVRVIGTPRRANQGERTSSAAGASIFMLRSGREERQARKACTIRMDPRKVAIGSLNTFNSSMRQARCLSARAFVYVCCLCLFE